MGQRRGPRRVAALVVVGLVATGLVQLAGTIPAAAAQNFGVTGESTPTGTVAVGERGVVRFTITNTSTAADAAAPLRFSQIRPRQCVDAACNPGTQIAFVENLHGVAGACAGDDLVEIAGDTQVEFVEPWGQKDEPPVFLDPPGLPHDFCTLEVPFFFESMPADRDPGTAGVQAEIRADVQWVLPGESQLTSRGATVSVTVLPGGPGIVAAVGSAPSPFALPVARAAVTPASNDTRYVELKLFGPDNPTCDDSLPYLWVGGGSVPTTNPSTFEVEAQLELAPGTYHWRATYGDQITGPFLQVPCTDPNMEVVIPPIAERVVTATPSPGGPLGTAVTDTIRIVGQWEGAAPATASLYGPDDADCSEPPVFTTPVEGLGPSLFPVTTPPFTPTAPGVYRWTFDIDFSTGPDASLGCGELGNIVSIAPTAMTLDVLTSDGGPLGSTMNAGGLLAPGSATGTMTFLVFGPRDPLCMDPLAVFTVALQEGTGLSPLFTPTEAGAHRWIVRYSGDANHQSVSNACGDPNATVIVTPSTGVAVAIAGTAAPATGTVGAALSDTAVLSGGTDPTGTITFSLYGPFADASAVTCTGTPAFTSTVPVDGAGSYTSESHTSTAAGAYGWVASYSGDANDGAAATTCGADGQGTVLSQATPTLQSAPSPGGEVGSVQLTTTLTLSGGVNPTGGVTGKLYGPDDADCSEDALVHASGRPVSGNGTYGIAGVFTPTQPGTYRWVTIYSGDANNAAVTLPCNAPGQSVEVTAPHVAQPTTIVADPILFRISPYTPSNGRLSARLTSAGQPVAGATIVFSTAGVRLCTAVTDATGRATCRPNAVGAWMLSWTGYVRATFDGNQDYLGSTDVAGKIE